MFEISNVKMAGPAPAQVVEADLNAAPQARGALCLASASIRHQSRPVTDSDDVFGLKGVAVLGDTVAGAEVVALDEEGSGRLKVAPLTSPQEPIPTERERHHVPGHIRQEDWCPIGVACRRPSCSAS